MQKSLILMFFGGGRYFSSDAHLSKAFRADSGLHSQTKRHCNGQVAFLRFYDPLSPPQLIETWRCMLCEMFHFFAPCLCEANAVQVDKHIQESSRAFSA